MAKMKEGDLKYWLALRLIEGLSSAVFKNLIAVFGDPRKVFDVPADALKTVAGVKAKTADSIASFKNWGQAEREMELASKAGVSIVTAHDPLYPWLLLNIYDYPPVLYVKGRLLEDDVTVAVVGSRAASTYGKYSTERLCRELALNGITIVSGMARGIDSAAHRGALSVKGRTIAVLGCGIDVVYPPENRSLHEEIASNGAVISEFPFSTPPLAQHFPMRNRIISGLSLGVVIVEATEKSGSLITARLALDQGREVFAVPGIIDSPGSKGTHRLIKEGAKLVENAHDILEEIRPQLTIPLTRQTPKEADAPPAPPGESLKETEKTVLDVLTRRAVDVDTIIEQTGFKAKDVLAILLSLELNGRIEQQPGKRFMRKEQ
jgi:DNA processing protein